MIDPAGMTALAARNLASMDLLHPDEEMDLASSPARPSEDVDLDLGDFRDPTPSPLPDPMSEDQHKLTGEATAEGSNTGLGLADENMFDDDLVDLEDTEETVAELAGAGNQDRPVLAIEEEDFLYDDEEETANLADSGVVGQNEEEVDELLFDEEVQDAASTANAELSTNTAQNPPEETMDRPITTADTSDPTLQTLKETTARDYDTTGGEPEQEPELLPADAVQEDLDASSLLQQEASLEPRASSQPASEIDAPDTGSHHSPSGQLTAHPVKVQYLGSETGLFPPFENDDSDVYFLHDVSLAFQPLDKMLAACRDALEGSLGHDDELVLDVPSLALHISEGSRHAAQLSLSQILDVYVRLGRNQELEHVAPLQCTLSSRVCLASQYAYMQSSAQEGRTLAAYVEENEQYVEESEVGVSQDPNAEDGATALPGQSAEEGESAVAQLEEDYDQEPAAEVLPQANNDWHQEEDAEAEANPESEGGAEAEAVPNTAEDALDLDQPHATEAIQQASDELELDAPSSPLPPTATSNLPPVEEVTSPTAQDPADTATRDDSLNEEPASNATEAASAVAGSVNGLNGLSGPQEAESDLIDETFDGLNGDYEIDDKANSGTLPQADQADQAGGEDDEAASSGPLNVDEEALQADDYEGGLESAEAEVEADEFLDESKPALKKDETVKQPDTYDDDLLDFDSDDDGAKQSVKVSGALSNPSNGTNGDSGRPSTPASVKKRKAEEEDDDYGLWDLDTPNKKRGRAS